MYRQDSLTAAKTSQQILSVVLMDYYLLDILW